MKVIAEEGRRPVKAWTDGVEFEDAARAQVLNVASLPFVHHHVAVMPDVHWGMGATVGSVIPTLGAIIPAAVGVDIGCGMIAVQTTLRAEDLPDNLSELRSSIEQAVPHGRSANGGKGDIGAWRDIVPSAVDEKWYALRTAGLPLFEKHPKIFTDRGETQLGTLGTGNHFIEICLDEAGAVWAVLHSGSRGIGNRIGVHFIELAKADMQRWFIKLPDAGLAYLPEGSEHFGDYVRAVSWAQEYALTNRSLMMDAVLSALARTIHLNVAIIDEAINCHHNYVERENHFGKNVWLTRKGAVRARVGDLGIIPGSMGARSYIVRGKGNPESFNSCSHGAGRRMSRGEARRRFSMADHAAATFGVECRKDAEVIDETPGAYKDVDAVMAAQSDLVEIVHTLKQVVCVKG